MSGKRPFAVLLIFTLIFISSCTKTAEGTQGPAGPAGADGMPATSIRTAITGYVSLVNQYAIADTILDSVNVSTRMGDSAISVLTDQTGKFVLPALKSGTYRIMFRRAGYDSFAVNVEHSAGNEDQFIDIIQIDGTQTTQILSQNMQFLISPFDTSSRYLDLNTIISGPLITTYTERFMNVYFSSSPSVSAHNFLYMGSANTHNEGTNQFNTQIYFAGSAVNNMHFQVGDTVYMKSYIVPPYSLATSWFDTNTYQTIPYPYTGDSLSNYFIWSN